MQLVVRSRALLALLTIGAILSPLVSTAPVYALGKPCSLDRNNLIHNGAMREGGLSQWGPVAEGWNAFVLSGSPSFNWVDNEGRDPYGSQYIDGDDQFDAGIFQTVPNLQAGVYYHFWVAFALVAVDKSGGVNTRDDQVGRMIGVDAQGGTDPASPNVKWGPEFRGGGAALGISAMDGVFAAEGTSVTVFVRAINHSSQFRHKAWFQTICMEPRSDLPTATPLATASSTAAPTDTPRPTRLPATAVPATDVPTDVPTDLPTGTSPPTSTNTPTITLTPSDTPRPRRAFPQPSPGAGSTDGPNGLPTALVVGSIGVVSFGGLGVLGLIAFIIWQVTRHRSNLGRGRPRYAYPYAYDEMDQFNEAIDPRLPPDEQLPGDIF